MSVETIPFLPICKEERGPSSRVNRGHLAKWKMDCDLFLAVNRLCPIPFPWQSSVRKSRKIKADISSLENSKATDKSNETKG